MSVWEDDVKDLLSHQCPSRVRVKTLGARVSRNRDGASSFPAAQPFYFSQGTLCTASSVIFNVQDDEDFQERVTNSATPVIVDFHAEWCGPCKMLAPRLEKLVGQQNGKVVMAKVDIDDHTDLALQYQVSAVPTVMAVKDGKVVDKFVGLKEEDQLEAFVKKLLC
ncbi:hypothetical protein NDU88_005914 [Pleurodeles waltl]|uniref:Thioredoxin, mitochondrial n=1 Tax=Pleurodeles waltl TaxID=8319 RepID=A0AAV7TCH2_PLEWA|nr:hypothetical protein NDU88_005914 [Pleurodeles waltl]